jgi:putative restriction endonuclease
VSALSAVIASRLEKAAVDNGFDQQLPRDDAWLVLASTQCPLRIWLGSGGEAGFVAAFSRQNVAAALAEFGTAAAAPLPPGALAGLVVADIPALHHLLRRAFRLSRTLPDELLRRFQEEVAGMSRQTEAERLVVQRVGQGVFRQGLLDYWEERCAVTGLAVPALLCASHIKPWADCQHDAERLDVYNGLLLAPHLDRLFDLGFITVADDGAVVVGDAVDGNARRLLGLESSLRVERLHAGHRSYLPWHRERVFRGAAAGT